MSAALDQPLVRRLTATRAYLRAEFGNGTRRESAELYRAVAVTCVEQQITRLLIVAGDDEPANERALRNALTTMVLAGISPAFKLAVVADEPRVAYAYRNLQRDVTAAGVTTRVFDNEEEATSWLADDEP